MVRKLKKKKRKNYIGKEYLWKEIYGKEYLWKEIYGKKFMKEEERNLWKYSNVSFAKKKS